MPMPTSVLNTLIKLRHMSGEEIREYFQKRADFHSKYPNNPKSKFTAKEWAIDHIDNGEKWHGLKNEKTYSKHFE
jgi:hypothetical protein